MKFKLLIYTLLTVALAGGGVSCTTDDGPGPLPAGEGPFEVSVTDITFRNALIRVVPDDATMKYYSHILPKASFAKRNYDVAVFLAEYWQVVAESTGLSVPEIVEQSLVQGNDEWEYPYLDAGTEYVVFAVGLNADGTPSTKPAFAEFKSSSPGPLERVDCTFDIDVTNIQYTSADFTIEATNKQVPYFYSILKAADWDAAGDKQAFMHNLLKNEIDRIMDEYDYTYKETVVNLTSRGNTGGNIEPGGLRPGTEYIVLAFGFDTYERATTDPGVERFRTQAVTPSDNTFTVTVQDRSAIDVAYRVETTNDDPYFTGVYDKALIGGLSDDALIAALEETAQIDGYFNGSGDYDGMQMLIPDTDYQIVTVGYDMAATTSVVRTEFRTLSGGDPAACTFEFDIQPSAMTVNVAVNPSDETVFYFFDLVPRAEFVSDAAYIKQICDDIAWASEDMGATMQETLLNVCYRGYTENEYPTKSKTDYYVVAFALKLDGTAAGALYKEEFTAAEQIVSNAKAEVELVKYYNGKELYDYDPQTYRSYVDYSGAPLAYAVCRVTHNEDAVTWYAALFSSEVMNSSDAAIIKNLIDYGGGEQNSETLTKSNTAYFSDVQYDGSYGMKNAFVAVALDKDGNYGPIFRKEFSIETTGASPISELVGTNPAVAAQGRGVWRKEVAEVAEVKPSFAARLAERPLISPALRNAAAFAAPAVQEVAVEGVRPSMNGTADRSAKSVAPRSVYGSGRVR